VLHDVLKLLCEHYQLMATHTVQSLTVANRCFTGEYATRNAASNKSIQQFVASGGTAAVSSVNDLFKSMQAVFQMEYLTVVNASAYTMYTVNSNGAHAGELFNPGGKPNVFANVFPTSFANVFCQRHFQRFCNTVCNESEQHAAAIAQQLKCWFSFDS
jgi:hypothetical protein